MVQDVTVKGDVMTITVKLSKGAPSKSGKSTLVATTGGFVSHGEYRIGLNVIK